MKTLGKATEFQMKDLDERQIFYASKRGIRSSNLFKHFYEGFDKRPALNAVIDLPGSDSTSPTAAAFLAYNIANRNFEVAGQNMTTALCTFREGGGVTLTTAGAENDEALLCPHANTNQSPWAVAGQFGTENSPGAEWWIKTGASVALMTIFAGFKKTNTPVIATDSDQCMFRYEASVSANWQVVNSRSNVDESTTLSASTSNLGTLATLAADTLYRLRIEIDDLVPHFYINDIDAYPAGLPPLVTAVDLYPFFGVKANTGSAKACSIIDLHGSRKVA